MATEYHRNLELYTDESTRCECDACYGLGWIEEYDPNDDYKYNPITVQCSWCSGTGEMVFQRCALCGGLFVLGQCLCAIERDEF